MAYLRSQNTIILQIAKSGSSSLVKAAGRVGELDAVGHLSISATIDAVRPPYTPRVVAVVRDPIDRLVSAINYKRYTVDHVLRYSLHQASFKPQSWWFDFDCDVDIYPLSKIGDAVRSIGYDGDIPKENASKKWITLDELKRDPKFDRLVSVYNCDGWITGL